jgi:phage terminase Nu1 subunit (DNA packaging protein)
VLYSKRGGLFFWVPPGEVDVQDFLTAKELAASLRVSVAAVRAWTRRGLPHIKLGRRLVRYNRAECVRWLACRTSAGSHGAGRGAD